MEGAYPSGSCRTTEEQRDPSPKAAPSPGQEHFLASGGVARSLSGKLPGGYARHSRLASHYQLLLRGLLLFMRWLQASTRVLSASRTWDRPEGSSRPNSRAQIRQNRGSTRPAKVRTLRPRTGRPFDYAQGRQCAPRFRESSYGRLCPRSDRTRLTSADVIAPSMFTSSRKLLPVTGKPT